MTAFTRAFVDWSGARSAEQRNSHSSRHSPQDGVIGGAKLDHGSSGIEKAGHSDQNREIRNSHIGSCVDAGLSLYGGIAETINTKYGLAESGILATGTANVSDNLLAEKAEELAIVKKAAYIAKNLK